MKSDAKNSLTQSVVRAFSILSCFTPEQPNLRVTDFAQKLGLTQSNVSRLLATMESMGYISKDETTNLYKLGTEVIALSSIAINNYEVRKQALPELYKIESTYGLSANLGILNNQQMFYLAHVDSHSSPKMYTMVGTSQPLHATGIGKILLAYLPVEEQKKILEEKKLDAFTNNTITDLDELYSQLQEIREKGYAIEKEELALGRACIASPIRNNAGKVIAGMSISGSLSMMNLEEREKHLSQIAKETAQNISEKLGFFSTTY